MIAAHLVLIVNFFWRCCLLTPHPLPSQIGAAAVAGGGLLLVTGGLAAPLLAGLSGAVLGAVPVAGVVAAGVVQSSAGMLAITAGLGAYGASRAARAAREMVGGVQQFGFLVGRWEAEGRGRGGGGEGGREGDRRTRHNVTVQATV